MTLSFQPFFSPVQHFSPVGTRKTRNCLASRQVSVAVSYVSPSLCIGTAFVRSSLHRVLHDGSSPDAVIPLSCRCLHPPINLLGSGNVWIFACGRSAYPYESGIGAHATTWGKRQGHRRCSSQVDGDRGDGWKRGKTRRHRSSGVQVPQPFEAIPFLGSSLHGRKSDLL